jgi:hypothetical protein
MAKKEESKGTSLGCIAIGCRAEVHRLEFCTEHFDQFKFGLIKKDGTNVPDYEKKLGHYQAYKTKRSAHKVA